MSVGKPNAVDGLTQYLPLVRWLRILLCTAGLLVLVKTKGLDVVFQGKTGNDCTDVAIGTLVRRFIVSFGMGLF